MARNPARPLSPHLTVWRWGPHMLVSILHRATGSALAFGGGVILIWWLAAAAGGPASYESFRYWVVAADAPPLTLAWIANVVARIVGVGLTWSLFQHGSTGVRHLLLDTGAGYELKTNRTWAIATMIVSATLTVLVWALILMRH